MRGGPGRARGRVERSRSELQLLHAMPEDLAEVDVRARRVDDDVHLAPKGRAQRTFIVGEEVMPPTTALDASASWEVETEVRVGEQENPNDVTHFPGAVLEATGLPPGR